MTMMNSDDLDSNVVGIAAFLYIIADLQTTVRTVTEDSRLNLSREWFFDVAFIQQIIDFQINLVKIQIIINFYI